MGDDVHINPNTGIHFAAYSLIGQLAGSVSGGLNRIAALPRLVPEYPRTREPTRSTPTGSRLF